jgi:monovalent cation:H+ antiporter, CPA1 family
MAIGVLLLMLLLVAGFIGMRAAALLRIPHSIFWVTLGLIMGAVIRARFKEYGEILPDYFPDTVLFILLPPLVFESAYSLDIALLKREWLPISALSILSLIISTFLIGCGIHASIDLPLLPSLAFGALISATDPVGQAGPFRLFKTYLEAAFQFEIQ